MSLAADRKAHLDSTYHLDESAYACHESPDTYARIYKLPLLEASRNDIVISAIAPLSEPGSARSGSCSKHAQ